jgi:PhzF family phenazine biosynthesis protein
MVDVFTRVPLKGNLLAVVPDATGLGEDEMLAIARQLNLSETTFVEPAGGNDTDYGVRIFTPRRELAFAGHPTLGTAHALIETGVFKIRGPRFTLRQETLAGIQVVSVETRDHGRTYFVETPAPEIAPGPSIAAAARALGIGPGQIAGEPLTVTSGVTWQVVPLGSVAVARSLVPQPHLIEALARETDAIGMTVFCKDAERPGCKLHVRSFAPSAGVLEDPVCGSGNACVGAYLARTGEPTPLRYVAEQGLELGRDGRVDVQIETLPQSLRVRIGGEAVTILQGELRL